jgi:PAS domain S-box-containing protein
VLVTVKVIELSGKTFLDLIYHDITEIKKVQEALMESEASYRQLVELAQEGICAVDNDFKVVFVNPRMAQMLGYAQSEIVGKTIFALLDASRVNEAEEFLAGFKQGISGQFEYSFPRKDGTHVDTSITASPIKDDQGKQFGTLALVTDVSERKTLEDELRESEERFRAISTSAMDAIILLDREGTVLYWNPAAERIFGFSGGEAVGRKLSELVIPSHAKEKHTSLMKRSAKELVSKHFEYRALRKDGTSFPIDISITSVKLKDKDCVLGIVRDVSERKTMEEALRQERDMLETMAESIDAGLTIIGKDYRIVWANRLLKRISGYEHLEGKPCSVLYGESDEFCSKCGVKKVFENGAVVDRQDHLFKSGEAERWVELIVTPIKDKDGNVVAALELVVDVTERKRMQKKLADYSQRLEDIVQKRTLELINTQEELMKAERFAGIGELAGMIGHDLRNPLTGIKNAAYFLKKKGTAISKEQSDEMLEAINKCVDYSNKIINDLLDYSREIHLDEHDCSPKRLVEDSLMMLQVPQNVEIQNELADALRICVDPEKMQRVFGNLLKNAFEAMPSGGSITIKSQSVGGNLEISIADTGTGIPAKFLPNLFCPLYTTKPQGMGFGLAVCKRLVEAHGGTISVETSEGKGTTFKLTLPMSRKNEIGGDNVWIIPESSLSMTTKT